jgi:8-oxo-dGTP diphosphatase
MRSLPILEHSKTLWKTCIPHISVDNVVFGFNQGELKVLLLKMINDDKWILPGGYVHKDENLDEAVYRVLQERTGVQKIFLEQFATFGKVNRTEDYFKEYDNDLWHKQRFISTCYYALVDFEQVKPVADEFSEVCAWQPVYAAPEMVMDHRQILDMALQVLRERLNYKPIGYNLLQQEFTLTELQNLYEVILGVTLNRGNFYRRIMKYNILIKLPKTRKGGSHKAPDLYQFDPIRYEESLKNFNW